MYTLKSLKEQLQEALDRGASTVESAHQVVAQQPLALLGRVAPARAVKTIGELQRRGIGRVYGALRTINHMVTEVAGDLLGAVDEVERERARRQP